MNEKLYSVYSYFHLMNELFGERQNVTLIYDMERGIVSFNFNDCHFHSVLLNEFIL